MYESLLDALRRGDAAQATHHAREAVAAQPHDATAHRLLAAALQAAGDNSGALAAIDAALERAPDNAELHLERAGLLLGSQRVDEAEAALATTTALNPNEFRGYVMQGQLALTRGDLDEAERLARLAARLDDAHPLLRALQGTVALRRGDAEQALALLHAAAQALPDEPSVLYPLAFAYMSQGHYAFAEQAFRTLSQKYPEALGLRTLVADMLRQQGRGEEALDEVRALAARHDLPALHRLQGELELAAGRPDAALEPLRAAFTAYPGDSRTVNALVQAWQQLGREDEAREALERALEASPQEALLWQARLAFEPFAGDSAAQIVDRWAAAAPTDSRALSALVTVLDATGRRAEADAVARRITEVEPGHTQAEFRVVNALMRDEPEAAVARVQELMGRASGEAAPMLQHWLAHAQLAAGRKAEALAIWSRLHAARVERALPLPPRTAPVQDWPAATAATDSAPPAVLLWGAPGSGVERVAQLLKAAGGTLLEDRFGATPRPDLFQRPDSAGELRAGTADAAALVQQWREALQARAPGGAFDWLLHWDNAWLLALRQALPEGRLLVVLRDPRDMLLDWLAYGAPAPFALPGALEAAGWLAGLMEQVAELHEGELYPHRLLGTDASFDDAARLAQDVGALLGVDFPEPPAGAFGPAHFPAGAWRAFTAELAEPFARLTPVATRLGYPET